MDQTAGLALIDAGLRPAEQLAVMSRPVNFSFGDVAAVWIPCDIGLAIEGACCPDRVAHRGLISRLRRL